MQTLCLYHNDADGRAAAAIVRRALGKDVWLHEINYGEPVPWEKIEQSGRVVIADFSLSGTDMARAATGRDFIWIDHHISAIEEMKDIASGWPGLRDTAEAACVLTWLYFFPGQPVPRAIVLIGDRDAWHWREPETGPFSEGLLQYDTSPENDSLWTPLLQGSTEILNEIVELGSVLRTARLRSLRREVESFGFPITFEGYRALAINIRGNGDIKTIADEWEYDLVYCYIDNWQNGRLVTFVSLYSSKIDVSEIAKKFGGGGHRGASGFNFLRETGPFPPEARISL